MTYGVTAWGPWVIALLALMAAGYVIWKKSQVGVIPTDASGRYQVMVVEHNGQKTVIMPDRMASPVLALRDEVSAPMLTDTETQKTATHGAQVVDAVKSLPPGYQRQAVGMASSLTSSPAAQVNIQVVRPDRLGPVLDEVEGGLLEGA